MKKMLVLLAAAALTATAALAQTAPEPTRPARAGMRGNRADAGAAATPEQRAERQTQRLTRELNLSPTQATQMQALLLAQQQENDALRTQPATDRRAAMQQMRDKYETQLSAVLTPEQRTRFTQLRNERREKTKDKTKDGKMKVKTQS